MISEKDWMESLMSTIAEFIDFKVEKCIDRRMSETKHDDEPHYYSRREVCEILHVTPMTLRNWVVSGKLVQRKIGKRVLFDKAAIDDAVKCQKLYRYKH
jgi:excisionase family DNA binding protein